MNKHLLALLSIGAGLALVGGGVYFARKYLTTDRNPTRAPPSQAAIERTAIPVPRVTFTDVTTAAGIAVEHYNGSAGSKLLPETMGGGVCVLDYDGDGWQDILFLSGCAWPGHPAPDKPLPSCVVLYRNRGNGTFEDVTMQSGLATTMYAMGACSGDIDNDGYADLFITGVGGCRLFHNVDAGGHRRFRDITAEAGLQPTGGAWPSGLSAEQFIKLQQPIEFPTTATFVDYDGDGKLDLFVCHYVKWSPAIDLSINATLTGIGRAYLQPQQFEGAQCRLYRNQGGKRFEDVTETAGVKVVEKEGTSATARERPVAKSLGVVICDPDNDGWPDLLVANDTVRNFFFHNVPAPNGGRQYEEKGLFSNAAYAEGKPRGAMGIDWAEYLPGKFGCVIANFANEPITFLTVADANPNKLRFTDSALAVGLAGPSRRWLKFGTFFFDYDLDGRLDLLVCNGHLEPEIALVQKEQNFAQPAQLFWNTGDQQRLFEPVTEEQAGPDLFKPMVGRGCAYLDYDGDGDLDVILIENNGSPRLLRNDTRLGHHYVRLHLVGDGSTTNTSAIGAKITIEARGHVYQREVAGARGYLSQSELPITIGLGTVNTIDRITVRWPGKESTTQVWTNLAPDQFYTLRQGQPDAEVTKPNTK
jgi:hypothetical protein